MSRSTIKETSLSKLLIPDSTDAPKVKAVNLNSVPQSQQPHLTKSLQDLIKTTIQSNSSPVIVNYTKDARNGNNQPTASINSSYSEIVTQPDQQSFADVYNATPVNTSYYSQSLAEQVPQLVPIQQESTGNISQRSGESALKSVSKQHKTPTASYSSYKSISSVNKSGPKPTSSGLINGEPKYILTRVTKYVSRTVRKERIPKHQVPINAQ